VGKNKKHPNPRLECLFSNVKYDEIHFRFSQSIYIFT